MGIGVHHDSVLSLLLFTMVREVRSHEFCTGVPREPLYADDMICVPSVILHASETWGPNTTHLQRHCRNDCAMIRWSVAPNTETKRPQLHYYKSWLRIWQQSFAVGGSDGMDMYSVSCVKSLRLSNLWPQSQEGFKKMVWRYEDRLQYLWSGCHWPTHKTEMYGEPAFNIARCCQHYRIGHGQHHNL